MNKTTIYFKYGCMNSGKSLDLMKIAYNYEENNIKPLILKPIADTKEKGHIISRIGLKKQAIEISNKEEVKKLITDDTKVILIDEAQFLDTHIIDEIVNQSYNKKVGTIMFFGLKSDCRGNLFPGSKRIIEICDKIEESTSICWCGKKARQNVRVVNAQMIKDGPTVLIDEEQSEVKYITLCNYHYFKGEINEK